MQDESKSDLWSEAGDAIGWFISLLIISSVPIVFFYELYKNVVRPISPVCVLIVWIAQMPFCSYGKRWKCEDRRQFLHVLKRLRLNTPTSKPRTHCDKGDLIDTNSKQRTEISCRIIQSKWVDGVFLSLVYGYWVGSSIDWHKLKQYPLLPTGNGHLTTKIVLKSLWTTTQTLTTALMVVLRLLYISVVYSLSCQQSFVEERTRRETS